MTASQPTPPQPAASHPPLPLQLLAVLGAPHRCKDLFEIARMLRLTDASGRAFQAKDIGALLQQACRRRQVVLARDHFECTPEYALTAFKAAVLSGQLASWSTALLQALGVLDALQGLRPFFNWEENYPLAVRIAAFSERPELLQQVLQKHWGQHSLGLASCLHGYVDADLLGSFEPQLAEGLVTQLLDYGLVVPHITTASLFEWALRRTRAAAVAPQLRLVLLLQLLWRMRFVEAAELAGSNLLEAALVRAHTAAMQGQYLESLPHFERAAHATPVDAEGRRGRLPAMSLWLQLSAMIACDVPEQLDAAAKLCRKLSKGAADTWFCNSLQFVISARTSGSTQPAWFTVAGASLLDDLTQAIGYAWLRQRPDSHGISLIEGWARVCETSGYLWPAGELRACLAIWNRCPPPPSLAGVFQEQQTWQRSLTALAALQGVASTAAEDAQTRIIWRVELGEGGVVWGIEPWEQKRSSRGWNRGKKVGLGTLVRDEALESDDARVVRAARALTASSYELDVHRAARALIGHPRVFFDEDLTTPVELTAAEPELLVTRVEQGGAEFTRLVLRPGAKQILAAFERATLGGSGKAPSDPCLIHRHAGHSAQVIVLNATHRRIAQLVGAALDVPAGSTAELQAALAGAARHCIVHAETAAAGNQAPNADGTLRAELSPRGTGLRMQLVVRPLGKDGPRYTPGRGAAHIFARIEGQPRAVLRDLDAERAAVAEVTMALERFAVDVDALQVDCDLPGACLELLEQLQSMAPRLQVDWPAGVRYRLSRNYTPAEFKVSIGRRHDWFAVEGGLHLDDGGVLELRRLLDAARRGYGRFVPLGEDGFVALSDTLARRMQELALLADVERQSRTPEESGAARLPLAAVLALADITEGMQLEASAPWQQSMQRIAEAMALQPEPPSTLQAQMRPYQLEGYRWLVRLAHWGAGACLADDMGLGKTLQTLAVLLQRAAGGPALVVAPTSVCQNWLDEARRFAPALRVQWFVGPERAELIEAGGPFDVLVCSYTLLQQDIAGLAAKSWHSVVLDEAQAVKNFSTKRAQAVLALRAEFRLAVTGTPVENRLEELWMVFRFLNPGLLGSREHFAERFVAPIERNSDTAVRTQLRRLIAPFMLRRTKSEVLTELPPRTEITLSVEPEAEEAAFHEALRQNALAALADPTVAAQHKRFQVLAELMRVRRACCHPQLVAADTCIGSAKLKAFLELVRELSANRHKALVFSQFVDYLAVLRAQLDAAGIRYQYLDGTTPATQRVERVQAFQSGAGDLFLISLRAGGVGLNLTAADYVIITDPWWNPAVEDQAASRAHRMGQARPVTVYRLVVKDSIEERIMHMHAEKRALAEGLFSGEEFGGAWSVEELMQLLQGGG